jgi:hypothetical protein
VTDKCAPGEGFQVAAESRALLSKRDVDPSAKQQTRMALEYFSRNLTAAATAAPHRSRRAHTDAAPSSIQPGTNLRFHPSSPLPAPAARPGGGPLLADFHAAAERQRGQIAGADLSRVGALQQPG